MINYNILRNIVFKHLNCGFGKRYVSGTTFWKNSLSQYYTWIFSRKNYNNYFARLNIKHWCIMKSLTKCEWTMSNPVQKTFIMLPDSSLCDSMFIKQGMLSLEIRHMEIKASKTMCYACCLYSYYKCSTQASIFKKNHEERKYNKPHTVWYLSVKGPVQTNKISDNYTKKLTEAGTNFHHYFII